MRHVVLAAFLLGGLLGAAPALAQGVPPEVVVRAVESNAAAVLGHPPSEEGRVALERIARTMAAQDPAKARKFVGDVDQAGATLRAGGPVFQARSRESWLGKWAFTPGGDAIDQAANDVILRESGIVARDAASRTVLTRRGVESFVAALDMMVQRGGRGTLTPEQRVAFARGVVAAYGEAPRADKLRIAGSESRYWHLRANLERSTPAQQAELARQVGGLTDAPGLVRLGYAYMNAAEDPAAPRAVAAGGPCALGWMCDKQAVHNWAAANAMTLLNPHL